MSEVRVQLSDRTKQGTVFVEVFVKRPVHVVEGEEVGGWERIHVSEQDLARETEIDVSFA